MRAMNNKRRWLGVALGGLLGCSGEPGTVATADTAVVSQALESNEVGGALEVSLPDGFTLASAAIGANGQLSVNDRARIDGGSYGLGCVVNVGAGMSELGADAQLGDLFGGGGVFLRERSFVSRKVQAGAAITQQNGVTVMGSMAARAPLAPAQSQSWLVTFAEGAADITLVNGQTRTLIPGSYRNVTVNAGTRLTLGTGTYNFQSLKLEPQSTLTLNPGAGSVVINVRSELIFRGVVPSRDTNAAKVLVGYFGTAMAAVEAPFGGTLVAPNARIKVESLNGATHYGAFFGKDVEVHQGARVVHRPFQRLSDLPFVTDSTDPLAVVPAAISVVRSGVSYELRYLPTGQLMIDLTGAAMRLVPTLTGDAEILLAGRRCAPSSSGTFVFDCLNIPPASLVPVDRISVLRPTVDPWRFKEGLDAILRRPGTIYNPVSPATLFRFEHMYVPTKLSMKFQTTGGVYDRSSDAIKSPYLAWSNEPGVIPNKHDFLTALNDAAAWLRAPDRFTNFRGQPTTALTAGGDGRETEGDDQTEPRYFISLEEAWRLYVWWAAHNVALDMAKQVPWLVPQNMDHLAALFDSTEMMLRRPAGDFSIGWGAHPNFLGTPWSSYLGQNIIGTPRYTYRFLVQNGIIGENRLASIEAMLEWSTDLVHFEGFQTRANAVTHWGHRYFPTVEKVIDGTIRPGETIRRHWTMGCHGTSQFVKDVLRAINIPVRVPFMCNHAQIVFPSEGRFVDHGDNPYSLRNAGSQCPVSHLLLDEATFSDLYGPAENHQDPAICEANPDPVGYQVSTGLELCN